MIKETRVKGQTVFITGASSGFGKASAEQFAKIGANLIITARREERLKKLANELSSQYGIQCLSIPLDVCRKNEVENVFKKLEMENQPIDVLINNAGLALRADKIQDSNIENWETMIDTNIKGLLYVTKFALPSMIKRNQGHIINIGSVSAHGCYVGGNVYCATKHAVRAISQSLRMDLIGTAIRVTEIDPGAAETEFSNVRFDDNDKAKKYYQGFQPLIADDIADAIIYCATRSPHVNISEMIIHPQAQASLTEIYRKEI